MTDPALPPLTAAALVLIRASRVRKRVGRSQSYSEVSRNRDKVTFAFRAESRVLPVGFRSRPITAFMSAMRLVLHESTPEAFRRQLRRALSVGTSQPLEHRLAFLKSWDEWAEGNYVGPDLRFGRAYLQVLRDEVVAEPSS